MLDGSPRIDFPAQAVLALLDLRELTRCCRCVQSFAVCFELDSTEEISQCCEQRYRNGNSLLRLELQAQRDEDAGCDIVVDRSYILLLKIGGIFDGKR